MKRGLIKMIISYSLDNQLIFDKEINKSDIIKFTTTLVILLLMFSPVRAVRNTIQLRQILRTWFEIY